MVVAPPSSATAATAAALLAGGAVLLALKWRRSGEGPPEGFPNRVELLEGETSAIMMGGAPSVSAVTFYAGDPESAADWLGRRVAEIVRANPWLAGRLDRRARRTASRTAAGDSSRLCTVLTAACAKGDRQRPPRPARCSRAVA